MVDGRVVHVNLEEVDKQAEETSEDQQQLIADLSDCPPDGAKTDGEEYCCLDYRVLWQSVRDGHIRDQLTQVPGDAGVWACLVDLLAGQRPPEDVNKDHFEYVEAWAWDGAAARLLHRRQKFTKLPARLAKGLRLVLVLFPAAGSPYKGQGVGTADYWEEEEQSWIRHHITPRTNKYYPREDETFSGRDTITEVRQTIAEMETGEVIEEIDEWTRPETRATMQRPWTGVTKLSKLSAEFKGRPSSPLRPESAGSSERGPAYRSPGEGGGSAICMFLRSHLQIRAV